MVNGGFYVLVEGGASWDVAEGWDQGVVEGPTLAEDYDLHELAAGSVVVGAEGAVGVAGDYAVAAEVVYSFVEVVA